MTYNFDRRTALKLLTSSALAGYVAAPALSQGAAKASWIPDEERQAMVVTAMKKWRVPGVGMAIIEEGDLVWEGSFGVANLETQTPIQNDSLFQAASLTKPLFAYIILRMIDAGQIGLEDRLIDYYRPDDLSDSEWNAEITVRHVLTHQTGLPNWRPADDETALIDPAFKPGTGYSYSGEAFSWLQEACEVMTGLGLNDLADQYLFTPAGLTDMAMLWTADRDEREVYGHIIGEDGEAELASLQFAREQGWRLDEVAERWGRPMRHWDVSDIRSANALTREHTHPRLLNRPLWRSNRPGSMGLNSASSLRTTPGDYARFLTLLMPGNQNEAAGISDELKQMMLSIQTDVSENGPNRPVGLSWSLEKVEGGMAYDHWGFNAGQHISMGLGDTSNRRGIVIMTNGAQGNRFMDEVGPVLTGTNYRSFF